MSGANWYERHPWRVRFALFSVVLLAIILRSPELFIEPRLWAEEGSFYLRMAYAQTFQESLSIVYKRAGYFSLATNLPVPPTDSL